jgi:hypothetical protein
LGGNGTRRARTMAGKFVVFDYAKPNKVMGFVVFCGFMPFLFLVFCDLKNIF